MESSKLETSEFKIMLTNALREAIESGEITEEMLLEKDLAKRVIDECETLRNAKIKEVS